MDRETGPETRPMSPVRPDLEPPGHEVPRPREPGPEPDVPGPGGPGGPGRSVMADPRVPVWIRRAVVALVAGTAVGLWQSWRWGLTAAAVVAIIDTVYQSKAMSPIPAEVLSASARRRTRRRLLTLRPAGYQALHRRAIPGTKAVIDHLVVGPAGVFAVDSERWDRRLPVRATAVGTTASGMLYHGPASQSARLAHARWEAAQAGSLLRAELGQEITVSPAMVIYGPTVPWAFATLRGVDVFGGRRVRTFFRRQNRLTRGQRLRAEEIEDILAAAERALPPAD